MGPLGAAGGRPPMPDLATWESCEVIKKSMTKCVNEKQGTFFCKEIVDKFDKLCKTDEEKEDEKKEDEKKEE